MSDKETPLEQAKRIFRNHKAKTPCHNQNIMVIDWRNQNGSSEYYIRYILDLKMGSLIIQGDCGYAIASWQCSHTPAEIRNLSNNPYYFLSKLKCETDKYHYNEEDIRADLEEAEKYILKEFLEEQACNGAFSHLEDDEKFQKEFNEAKEWDEKFVKYLPQEIKNEFIEDWEEIISGIIEAKENNNAPFPKELTDLLNKYEQDWWENSLITEAGRRIDLRVYLWVYGFQMAMEQLENI